MLTLVFNRMWEKLMEQTQPSKMKYIGAWLLAGFITSVLSRIADTVIANAMVNDLDDLNAIVDMCSSDFDLNLGGRMTPWLRKSN